MSEYAYWKSSPEAQEILKELKELKEGMQEELVSGTLLQHKSNDELSREYALTVGRIEGLDMFLKIIDTHKEESENERDREL